MGPAWFQFSDVSVDLHLPALSMTRNDPPDFT
jgi:hypothetical protein